MIAARGVSLHHFIDFGANVFKLNPENIRFPANHIHQHNGGDGDNWHSFNGGYFWVKIGFHNEVGNILQEAQLNGGGLDRNTRDAYNISVLKSTLDTYEFLPYINAPPLFHVMNNSFDEEYEAIGRAHSRVMQLLDAGVDIDLPNPYHRSPEMDLNHPAVRDIIRDLDGEISQIRGNLYQAARNLNLGIQLL